MNRVYPPVTIEEIIEFEKRFEINLPQFYKNFILKSNGGIPNSIYYVENGADIVLNEILPLKHSNLSVEYYLVDLRNKWPHLIPFAEDAFGNLLMLSCDLDNEGIYFLDHETEELNPIGTDFNNFLDKLTDHL